MTTCCPVVELRQYTLHPHKRDVLIDLFEREFIEPQEAVGARVIGQFRDLDDPDRFVWLRGFSDMAARTAALSAFYDGPLWKSRRNAANDTINDSDNVLLLKPARADTGFPVSRLRRPPLGSAPDGGVILAGIHYLDADMAEPFTDFFEARMAPHLRELGLAPMASLVTETSENGFKRLPVRERDRVFIWFTGAADVSDGDRRLAALRSSQGAWREGASDPILHQLARKPEILRLSPAARSALRA